ncbi:MAG: PorT family protein [Cytophagales bacterium]|jgi:opacity protein-like surface antigen|nr:PorT family protein [Cytophagales bacterium]
MRTFKLAFSILVFTGAFWPVFAQKLTTRDVEEIQTKAKSTLLEYENLLNYISFEDGTEKEIQNAIERSYMPSTNQIFINKKVIVEDDVFPGFNKDNTQDLDIEKYLNKLAVYYTKTTDASIRFSSIQISNVKKKDFYYVKVLFESQFGSTYRETNAKYPSRQRLAVITAEQNAGKWITRIAGVTYYDPFKPIDSKENDVKVIVVEAGSSITIRSLTKSAEPKKWNVGLKAGAGVSSLRVGELQGEGLFFDDYFPKTAFTAGAFVRYHSYQRIGFTAEVLYATKGAEAQVVPLLRFEGVRGRHNLSYLEIPVMFNYYLMPGAKFKPYLAAGAWAGFLLGAESTLPFRDRTLGGRLATTSYADREQFQSFDYGLNAGLGFDTKVTRTHRMTAEVRYNYGLANAFTDAPSINGPYTGRLYNNTLILTVGYSFGLAD